MLTAEQCRSWKKNQSYKMAGLIIPSVPSDPVSMPIETGNSGSADGEYRDCSVCKFATRQSIENCPECDVKLHTETELRKSGSLMVAMGGVMALMMVGVIAGLVGLLVSICHKRSYRHQAGGSTKSCLLCHDGHRLRGRHTGVWRGQYYCRPAPARNWTTRPPHNEDRNVDIDRLACRDGPDTVRARLMARVSLTPGTQQPSAVVGVLSDLTKAVIILVGKIWDEITRGTSIASKHSALFNKGVTTPTLIQHGEADVRVPI
jgi:hypothetical protein